MLQSVFVLFCFSLSLFFYVASPYGWEYNFEDMIRVLLGAEIYTGVSLCPEKTDINSKCSFYLSAGEMVLVIRAQY